MSPWLLLKGAAVAVKTFAVVNAAPLGLIATGIGAIATGIIAWRAGKRSSLVIGQAKVKKGAPLTTGEKIKATWKLWLPVCVSIILTFGGAACTYYVQSAEIAELTATANTLIASNKELYSEVEELKGLVPEEVKKVEEQRAWEYVDRKNIRVDCGEDVIVDRYLDREFRMPINSAMYGATKFKEMYAEKGYGCISDLYYILGQRFDGDAGKGGWIETFETHNDPDYPRIEFREYTRMRESGEVESVWFMEYHIQCPEVQADVESVFQLRDELDDDYYRDRNDDELMNTISKAFA